VHPRLGLAALLIDVGRLDEAAAAVLAAADEVAVLGHDAWAGGPIVLRSRLLLAGGKPDDAAAEARRGLQLAQSRGCHLFSAAALSALATIALRRGDLRAAQEHMADARTGLSHYGATGAREQCLLTRARIAEARGGPREAMTSAAGLVDALPGHRGVLLADPAASSWLARVALGCADREHARRAADAAQRLASENPDFSAFAAAAAHARGLLERDPLLLEQAATQYSDPWAGASAAEDLGRLLAACAKRGEAVHALQTSLSGYERSGASRDAARIRRRLRRLGVRHRHWADAEADRPASGWASLTGTERAVCELVSQGLTNQQAADRMFLSVHTVAFHLRQVFRKLNIGSRVDLTRLALERAHAQSRQGGLVAGN
jgi:DNA-binding CsgD family transcriptional regulator